MPIPCACSDAGTDHLMQWQGQEQRRGGGEVPRHAQVCSNETVNGLSCIAGRARPRARLCRATRRGRVFRHRVEAEWLPSVLLHAQEPGAQDLRYVVRNDPRGGAVLRLQCAGLGHRRAVGAEPPPFLHHGWCGGSSGGILEMERGNREAAQQEAIDGMMIYIGRYRSSRQNVPRRVTGCGGDGRSARRARQHGGAAHNTPPTRHTPACQPIHGSGGGTRAGVAEFAATV